MGAEPRSLLETWPARTVVTGRPVAPFAGVPPPDEPFRLDQVDVAYLRDGTAAEVWEAADVGVRLRRGA